MRPNLMPLLALAFLAAPAGLALAVGTSAPGVSDGATVKVGALVITQPWIRATPGGAKVAGGYLRVSNEGTEPDRLIAASAPFAARSEMHEMSMSGGVMKMREVEDGIEIKPGQTVELKPGGYHLMFMALKVGVKAGETIRGTLTFAKAGTVEVTFPVAAIGAQGPTAAHRH